MELGVLVACLLIVHGVLLIVIWRLLPAGTRGRAVPTLYAMVLIGGIASLAVGAALENRLQFTDRAREAWWNFRAEQQGAVTSDPAAVRALREQRPLVKKPASYDRSEWAAWQTQVRGALQAAFAAEGVDQARPVISLEDSRQHVDGIEEISLRLLSWKGAEIPAVLFLPRTVGRAPAVLVIPGHVKRGESGLDQLAGKGASYQHGAARAIAREGFVTLAIELRGFGRLGPPRFPEHELIAYNALLAGTFYKALIVKDLKVAVDFLVSRAEVDAARLGITGASLGGELAVTYAALDSRIRAVAFHSSGGSTGTFPGVAHPQVMPHYCHVIPGSNLLFEQQDIFLLLAPRPTLGVRGLSEPFSNQIFRGTLERVWSILGDGKNLKLATEPGGHEFFVVPAVEFFRQHLRQSP